jgi:hypothetical protein
MIYTYDQQKLRYNKVSLRTKTFTLLISLLVIWLISTAMSKAVTKTFYVTGETKMLVLEEHNEFSEEKLDAYLKEINIKFPDIVKAQATLETGYFKSEMFIVNHNLFGMKVAKLRPTTALGENLGHAFYDNWKQSVLDYAFYQAAYLRQIKTDDEYLAYLELNYAEDPNYINKLKKLIK